MNENRLIMILGFAGFVVMADNWVVSPILPAISSSIQVSPVRAGHYRPSIWELWLKRSASP
jgi:predicted MFS family arabinose efflux permease